MTQLLFFRHCCRRPISCYQNLQHEGIKKFPYLTIFQIVAENILNALMYIDTRISPLHVCIIIYYYRLYLASC